MSITGIGRDFIPSLKELEKRATQAKFIPSTAPIQDAAKSALKVVEELPKAVERYTSPFNVTNESAAEINKLKSVAADKLYFNNAMKTRADWESVSIEAKK